MKHLFSFVLLFNCFSLIAQTADDRVIVQKSQKATNSEQAKDYYNQGVILAQKGDYSNAITYYKLAIKSDSSFIDAYDNVGLCYRKTDNVNEAIKYYSYSLKLNGSNVTAIMNLAVAYSLKKNYSKASELYKQLIDIEPNDAEGYYGLCQTLVNSGKDSEAINYCKKAEKIYSEKGNSYEGDVDYILCIAYYNTRDYFNAKKYLELSKKKGISVNPEVEQAIRRH
jgi:tetratricopeptide (TPR) repeat protein